MFDGLEDAGGGFNEGGLSEVSDDDEFVVFGFGVHAVVGLDVFGLEDGVFGVEDVLFAEDLHITIYFYQVDIQ